MSYESKVLVINRSKISDTWTIGQELARFDLCSMGYETFEGKMFRELFDTEIDFDIYVNHSDEVEAENFYRIDCYGEVCKYTKDLDSVISWLENSEKVEHYRRASMLLNFLKVFKNQVGEYDEICLVHYGY